MPAKLFYLRATLHADVTCAKLLYFSNLPEFMTRPERKYADFIWMQILQCYLSAVVYAFSGDKIICCWLSSSRAKLQITWIYFTLHVATISQMESIVWLQLNLKNGANKRMAFSIHNKRTRFLAKKWTKSIKKWEPTQSWRAFTFILSFNLQIEWKPFPAELRERRDIHINLNNAIPPNKRVVHNKQKTLWVTSSWKFVR